MTCMDCGTRGDGVIPREVTTLGGVGFALLCRDCWAERRSLPGQDRADEPPRAPYVVEEKEPHMNHHFKLTEVGP